MKVALYYPWIYLKGGIEKTILELVNRSRHTWTIFTSHFDAESTFSEFKDKKVIELKNISVKRSYLAVLKASYTIMMQKIQLENYDLLWVHSEGLGDFITFRNHVKPVICFCHTPLKLIHDHSLRKVYLIRNKIKNPLFILFSNIFKFFDKMAWKNYQQIFCISKEVKYRILKANLAPENKIEVLYRGVDTEKISPTWLYRPYFLHPTRIKWWKNVELSIEAFNKFQNKVSVDNEFRLLIAGQVDKDSKVYYQKLLSLCKNYKQIQIITDPAEEELKQLFENCYAVLNTTLNEDWGLVPLEAMAYGKPVIAVNQGGPKESIIDKKTGFLVEPTVGAFAEVMTMLAKDRNLVIEIGQEARRHSLKYDWKHFVKRVDEYLDSLKDL